VKAEILDPSLKPITFDTRRVLVMANDGVTPLALVLEYQPGMYYVAHCQDKQFNQVLERLGINCRVTVSTIDGPGLADLQLPPPQF
jgi:tagatose-1,6-bisphosphate aldolase non-catalytic subunit AgaZ/GatZ